MSFTLEEISTFWNIFSDDQNFRRNFPNIHFTANQIKESFTAYLKQLAGVTPLNRFHREVLKARLNLLVSQEYLSGNERVVVLKLLKDLQPAVILEAQESKAPVIVQENNRQFVLPNETQLGLGLKSLLEQEAQEAGISEKSQMVSNLIDLLNNRSIQPSHVVDQKEERVDAKAEATEAKEEKHSQNRNTKPSTTLRSCENENLNIGGIRFGQKKFFEAAMYFLLDLEAQYDADPNDPDVVLERLCGEAIFRSLDQLLLEENFPWFKERISYVLSALLNYIAWHFREGLSQETTQIEAVAVTSETLKLVIKLQQNGITNRDIANFLENLQDAHGSLGGAVSQYTNSASVGSYIKLLNHIYDEHTAPQVLRFLKPDALNSEWTRIIGRPDFFSLKTVEDYLELLDKLQKNGFKEEVLALLELQADTSFCAFLGIPNGRLREKYFNILEDTLRGDSAVPLERVLDLLERNQAKLIGHVDYQYLEEVQTVRARLHHQLVAPNQQMGRLLINVGHFQEAMQAQPNEEIEQEIDPSALSLPGSALPSPKGSRAPAPSR